MKRREHQQRQADPVDPDVKVGADGRDPRDVRRPTGTGRRCPVRSRTAAIHRGGEGGSGEAEGDGLRSARLLFAGQQQHQHRPRQGEEHDEAQPPSGLEPVHLLVLLLGEDQETRRPAAPRPRTGRRRTAAPCPSAPGAAPRPPRRWPAAAALKPRSMPRWSRPAVHERGQASRHGSEGVDHAVDDHGVRPVRRPGQRSPDRADHAVVVQVVQVVLVRQQRVEHRDAEACPGPAGWRRRASDSRVPAAMPASATASADGRQGEVDRLGVVVPHHLGPGRQPVGEPGEAPRAC